LTCESVNTKFSQSKKRWSDCVLTFHLLAGIVSCNFVNYRSTSSASENRAKVSNRPLGRKYRLYFSLFAFHFSLFTFPQPLKWLATIVKPLWGFHPFIFHFSLFTFHLSLVRRLVVGSRRTQRRQTADKPVGKRRSDGRQTAD
jgi:hypothetical protein